MKIPRSVAAREKREQIKRRAARRLRRVSMISRSSCSRLTLLSVIKTIARRVERGPPRNENLALIETPAERPENDESGSVNQARFNTYVKCLLRGSRCEKAE